MAYKIAIIVGSLREGQHQPQGRAVDLRASAATISIAR